MASKRPSAIIVRFARNLSCLMDPCYDFVLSVPFLKAVIKCLHHGYASTNDVLCSDWFMDQCEDILECETFLRKYSAVGPETTALNVIFFFIYNHIIWELLRTSPLRRQFVPLEMTDISFLLVFELILKLDIPLIQSCSRQTWADCAWVSQQIWYDSPACWYNDTTIFVIHHHDWLHFFTQQIVSVIYDFYTKFKPFFASRKS